MRPITFLLVLGLMLLPGTATAQATGQSVTITARATIGEILVMDVTGTSIEFPVAGNGALAAGFVPSQGGTRVVRRGNVPNVLVIQANSEYMTREDGTPTQKPVGDLQWSADGGSTWTPLSTERQQLPLGARDILYRLTVDTERDQAGVVVVQFTYHVLPI